MKVPLDTRPWLVVAWMVGALLSGPAAVAGVWLLAAAAGGFVVLPDALHMRTAKSLHLTIPRSVLTRVEEVIRRAAARAANGPIPFLGDRPLPPTIRGKPHTPPPV